MTPVSARNARTRAVHQRHVREWASSHLRPGKRFEPSHERTLHEPLRRLACGLPGADLGAAVIAEMPGPVGIPDLVIAVDSAGALKRRMKVGLDPVLSLPECRLLAAILPGRTLSLASIARRLRTPPERIAARVRSLTRRGLVVEHGSGWRRNPAVGGLGRVYALEAKMTDWRRGLGQLVRYGQWADGCALVLPTAPGNLGEARRLAGAFGIGLATGEGWILRPRIRRLDAGARILTAEYVLAAIVGTSPSSAV